MQIKDTEQQREHFEKLLNTGIKQRKKVQVETTADQITEEELGKSSGYNDIAHEMHDEISNKT